MNKEKKLQEGMILDKKELEEEIRMDLGNKNYQNLFRCDEKAKSKLIRNLKRDYDAMMVRQLCTNKRGRKYYEMIRELMDCLKKRSRRIGTIIYPRIQVRQPTLKTQQIR
eukprot:277520_1